MGDRSDPPGCSPLDYAPRWLREAEVKWARDGRMGDDHLVRDDNAAPAEQQDAEAEWMVGKVPRFILPGSRADPPERDRFGTFYRVLAVLFAALAAVLIAKEFSGWRRLVGAPQVADAGVAPARSPPISEPPAEPSSQETEMRSQVTEPPSRVTEPPSRATEPSSREAEPGSQVADRKSLRLEWAAAAPEQSAGSPIRQLDPREIADLIRRGEEFIVTGDLASARLVLQRAVEAGDSRAALMLAGTYDPIMLVKIGIQVAPDIVQGFAPDVALARTWYKWAKEFGSAEAARRLETLASPGYQTTLQK
jgi:hypothetical protein